MRYMEITIKMKIKIEIPAKDAPLIESECRVSFSIDIDVLFNREKSFV